MPGCAACRRRGEQGQSTVELALLLPVVVLLLLAVLQVALVARDVLLVAHAAREAARAAAVDGAPAAARQAAIDASGLPPSRLVVRVSAGDAVGDRVRVAVAYRAPTDVPLVGRLLPDPTIHTTVTMRVEHR